MTGRVAVGDVVIHRLRIDHDPNWNKTSQPLLDLVASELLQRVTWPVIANEEILQRPLSYESRKRSLLDHRRKADLWGLLGSMSASAVMCQLTTNGRSRILGPFSGVIPKLDVNVSV